MCVWVGVSTVCTFVCVLFVGTCIVYYLNKHNMHFIEEKKGAIIVVGS